MVSQAKTGEVLNVLRDAGDDGKCENQLVLLLEYDCFNFIKILKRHQQKNTGKGEDDESTNHSSRKRDHSDDIEIDSTGQVTGSRQLIDFEDLIFNQGSHFIAKKHCQLPDGSFRKQRKGYAEVHVPSLKPKPFSDNEKLISYLNMYSLCLKVLRL